MQNLLIAVCAKLKVNKKLQRRTVSKLSAASCIENRRYYFVSRVNKLEHTKTKGNTQTKKNQKTKHSVKSQLAGWLSCQTTRTALRFNPPWLVMKGFLCGICLEDIKDCFWWKSSLKDNKWKQGTFTFHTFLS